ncbi:methionine aminopeptidase [Methanocella arvoryzae MRE50]|uniref:Methionine aminopeptidase n=2 Tax=Methanocella TaxID=570266 RepID=Q0W260_METAR|nr:methionine aminopeptidase [Methanocella arvoryzae MRE50]
MAADELKACLKAGEIVRSLKCSATAKIRAGARLIDLATFVEEETVRMGGRPAFPCNISVNAIASHYTPSPGCSRTLENGDVVKIDLGAIVDGYIADSAFTAEVGTSAHRDLIDSTNSALSAAIEIVRPGVTTSEIGRAINAVASSRGLRVLRDLYGHNMSRNCLHGGLTIPNYDDGSARKIREGDILAIEPFLTPGSGEISRNPGGNIFQAIRRDAFYATGAEEKELLRRLNRDYGGFPFTSRWLGAETGALQGLIRSAAVREYPLLIEKDGEPVAQAEHTLIVTRDGCKIIT